MSLVQKTVARISRLNSNGVGEILNDHDEPIMEVPFALPQEIIEYSTSNLQSHNLIDIKFRSPHREKPLCRHFRECGGCSLQHASENFVKDWKKSVVVKLLEERNLFPQFRKTFITPERSRRRAVFSGRRTKTGTIVGFNSSKSDVIVSVIGCIVVDEKILSFLPGMNRIAGLGCSRSSVIKIHVSNSENGLDVHVKSGKPLDKKLSIDLAAIAVDYDLARLSWGKDLIAINRPPVQILGNVEIVPPEDFFMQATKESELKMSNDVCEALEGEKTIIDLFCGLGTFSFPLARTKKIFAFEQSPEMLKTLVLASRQNRNLKPINTNIRNLHKRPVTKDELLEIDGAVLNPTRAGANKQCAELAWSGIKTIMMISCNPISFARDAEILTRGYYNLDWVRVVDQFRWSHHIELVAKFSNKN